VGTGCEEPFTTSTGWVWWIWLKAGTERNEQAATKDTAIIVSHLVGVMAFSFALLLRRRSGCFAPGSAISRGRVVRGFIRDLCDCAAARLAQLAGDGNEKRIIFV